MDCFGKSRLEWSVAARPLPGESLSGDSHLVAKTSTGWLLAVVDGLGHGPEAAVAAKILIAVLTGHPDEPPEQLIRLGHEALKTTRGSVGAVVTIDDSSGQLCWLGVGNVEGVVLPGDGGHQHAQYIVTRGGIIGYRLPELRPSIFRLKSGDDLILATDGIETGFSRTIPPGLSPKLIATFILDRYAKQDDDALVLAGRWFPACGPQRETAS